MTRTLLTLALALTFGFALAQTPPTTLDLDAVHLALGNAIDAEVMECTEFETDGVVARCLLSGTIRGSQTEVAYHLRRLGYEFLNPWVRSSSGSMVARFFYLGDVGPFMIALYEDRFDMLIVLVFMTD